MKVVVHPDRVPRSGVRGLRGARHRLVFLDRILDLHQVHLPALRHENAKFQGHAQSLKTCRSMCSAPRMVMVIAARSSFPNAAARGATPSGSRSETWTDGLEAGQSKILFMPASISCSSGSQRSRSFENSICR